MKLLAACSLILCALWPGAMAGLQEAPPEHPLPFEVKNFYARASKDGTDGNTIWKFDVILHPTGRSTHCETEAWTTKRGSLKPLAPTVRVACQDPFVSFEISRNKQLEAVKRNDLKYVEGHVWLTLWWDTERAAKQDAARGHKGSPLPDWGILRAQEKVDQKYIARYPENVPHTLYEVYIGEGHFLMGVITWHTKKPPPLCRQDECGIVRPNDGNAWDIVSEDDPPLR